MLLGFGALGGVLWLLPWMQGQPSAEWGWTGAGSQVSAVCLWMLGALLALAGISPPPMAKPVYVFWMSLAMAIGAVMTTVLLTIMFMAFLPWFSMIVRLGDPLRKKLHPGDSYWGEYQAYPHTLERMQRPF